MHRRDFLRAAGAASAGIMLPGSARVRAQMSPVAPAWRTFEVTTRVEVLQPAGPTRDDAIGDADAKLHELQRVGWTTHW